MWRIWAWVLVVVLATPAISWAQEPQPAQAPTVDVSKMGVSLDRIRRGLASEPTEVITVDGLKLDVRVNVFGEAPRLDFVPEDFSLTYGPVPHSAPTHSEHIAFVTPKEYSSPPVPIFG